MSEDNCVLCNVVIGRLQEILICLGCQYKAHRTCSTGKRRIERDAYRAAKKNKQVISWFCSNCDPDQIEAEKDKAKSILNDHDDQFSEAFGDLNLGPSETTVDAETEDFSREFPPPEARANEGRKNALMQLAEAYGDDDEDDDYDDEGAYGGAVAAAEDYEYDQGAYGHDDDDNNNNNDDEHAEGTVNDLTELRDDVISFTLTKEGTNRGNPKLTDSQGFSYVVKDEYGCSRNLLFCTKVSVTYWSCSVRPKHNRCPATVIERAGNFTRGNNAHNHEPRENALTNIEIHVALSEEARVDKVSSASEIVNRVLAKYIERNPTAQLRGLPKVETLIRIVNRKRQGLRPPAAVKRSD